MHLVHLISGSVAKFLTFAFVTNEGFQARNSRDYPPVSVENNRDPCCRKLLGGQHSLEKVIWDADDHLKRRLSKAVPDGYINEDHPAAFYTLKVCFACAAELQRPHRIKANALIGSRFTRIDIFTFTTR